MKEDRERAELIASRPGLAPETLKLLMAAPIQLVRDHIKELPEQPINPELAKSPTRGSSQTALGQSPDEKRKLDERMGIVERNPRGLSTDTKLVLGGRKPSNSSSTPDAN